MLDLFGLTIGVPVSSTALPPGTDRHSIGERSYTKCETSLCIFASPVDVGTTCGSSYMGLSALYERFSETLDAINLHIDLPQIVLASEIVSVR